VFAVNGLDWSAGARSRRGDCISANVVVVVVNPAMAAAAEHAGVL
jgi:hypothetical protein